MENDEKTSPPQGDQSEACVPEQPTPAGKCAGSNSHEELQHSSLTRRDKNRYAARHGVLSRYPLEALVHVRENIRSLRRIERKFRAELKPSGFAAEMLFGEATYMPSDPASGYPA
jgi:hypothetical protein